MGLTNILLSEFCIDEDWCYEPLKRYLRPEMKVCILALSYQDPYVQNYEDWLNFYSPEKGKYYRDMTKPLNRFGIYEKNICWVNRFTDSRDKIIEEIKKADILYFPGGFPDQMFEQLKRMDLTELLKGLQDKIILGFSAGAMIQLSEYHITPDKDYDHFQYCEGIGYIREFDVEVHFTETEEQVDCIKRAIREKGKPIYGLYDNGGIIVKGQDIEVMGNVNYYPR